MEKIIIINNKETRYIVNDEGRIFNKETKKFLKGNISPAGYHYIRLSIDGVKYRFYTHRLVGKYFLENFEENKVINHKDGNKLNNNLNNLECVSQSENIKHAHDNSLISEKRKSKYFDFETDNLKDEKWLPYKENDKYLISNFGRIISCKSNNKFLLLKPSHVNGYLQVSFSNKGKITNHLVHYLVYETFYDCKVNKNLNVIDHIDRNKENNILSNLREISRSENVVNYTIPVVAEINGEIIEFPSMKEAARQLNCDSSAISKCCKGIYKHHHNIKFHYKESSTTI